MGRRRCCWRCCKPRSAQAGAGGGGGGGTGGGAGGGGGSGGRSRDRDGGRHALHVEGDPAFVAGDRQTDGVFALWSIARNMTVGWHARRPLIDRRREQQQAQQWRQCLGLVTPGIDLPMVSLSGGNQQKVLFA